MEERRKDARREPVIVDLEALVPEAPTEYCENSRLLIGKTEASAPTPASETLHKIGKQ